jgi:hypothetical protein
MVEFGLVLPYLADPDPFFSRYSLLSFLFMFRIAA